MIPHWMWAIWGIAGLAWAAWGLAMEIIAIADGNPHDTLSYVIWQHSHVPAVVFFLCAGIICFGTVWLLVHFVYEDAKTKLGS